MKKLALAGLLTALAVPAVADLEDEVRCREIGFSKSVENQDHERFASFVDPDARFVSETTEAWGTYNSVWRLSADGEWLIVFDAGSFPDETPSEEQRELLESDAGCE